MSEKRSLFQKIFGSSKQDKGVFKHFEMISDASSAFYAWEGNLLDSDIIRSCIRPKANAIGKLNAQHIRGYGEEMRINPEPYIREVMQNPNPYMSMQDFLMKMTWQREINNNAFAYIKRDQNGYPEYLYPLPALSVELLERGEEVFTRFQFRGGRTMTVPYGDIIHLRKDFVNNDFFGESGTSALRPLMEIINITDQGIVAAVKNSAIIRWLLKFKSVLKPADKEMQVKEFVSNYLSISNEGGAAASDPRYDVEQVKQDNFVPNASQMKESIQRLYSYFGVNDSIVQNKYSENDWNSFYESEIEPMLIQLSNAFTNAFFSRRERGFGNRIIFEAKNLAYASMTTKLRLVAMVDRGALSPNGWRAIMNLPPVPGGDEMIRRLDTAAIDDVKFPKEKEDETDEQTTED